MVGLVERILELQDKTRDLPECKEVKVLGE